MILSAAVDRFKEFLARLAEPAPEDIAGAASNRGTRDENQDCAGIAIVKERLFAVVADGMGGSPDGGRASLSACAHAFRAARESLLHPWFESGAALRAVADAFDAAARGVSSEAQKRGYSPERPGYGTTLIVAIADAKRYVFGYLGDGAIVLRRADGRVLDLLRPHRMLGARTILESSLGPVPWGEPDFGIVAREPGDLLLAGTDGLFDLAPPSRFVQEFHGHLHGSVQEMVETAVAAVAQSVDADGPVCDDNLSLVAIRTPRRKP